MPVNKLSDPYRYVHCAKITPGPFAFPMDMLRYDRCSPRDPIDVSNMTTKFHSGDSVVVLVVAYSRIKALSPFTIKRWESFGCKVEIV